MRVELLRAIYREICFSGRFALFGVHLHGTRLYMSIFNLIITLVRIYFEYSVFMPNTCPTAARHFFTNFF